MVIKIILLGNLCRKKKMGFLKKLIFLLLIKKNTIQPTNVTMISYVMDFYPEKLSEFPTGGPTFPSCRLNK